MSVTKTKRSGYLLKTTGVLVCGQSTLITVLTFLMEEYYV
jgi:hypothetical protein